MAVLEVKMVSGWAPEKHSLKQVSPISTAIFENCTLVFNQNSIASQNFTWFSLLITLFLLTLMHMCAHTQMYTWMHTPLVQNVNISAHNMFSFRQPSFKDNTCRDAYCMRATV